jgi:hypothetical protein
MLLRTMLPLGLMLEALRRLSAQAHRDPTVTAPICTPRANYDP